MSTVSRALQGLDQNYPYIAIGAAITTVVGIALSSIILKVAGVALAAIALFDYIHEKYFSSPPLTTAFPDATQEPRHITVESQNKMQQDLNEGYIIPKRRICGFSPVDSTNQIQQAAHAKFISESEIIGTPHEMRFLPSPFKVISEEEIEEMRKYVKTRPRAQHMVENCYATNEKLTKAIGVTKEGRHVILQQAVRSCVPTSVAMIVLDHGGTPDYHSISDTHLLTKELDVRWFENTGFSVKSTSLSGTNRVHTLIQCLKENGAGVLSISDAAIDSHAIVLDAISIEDDMATIRDPFHGWCIDIKLGALEKMMGNAFMQVTGKKP